MLFRAVGLWCALLMIAVMAGNLSAAFLEPLVGERSGQAIGTTIVVSLFIALIWRTVDWVVPSHEVWGAWRIGLAWVVATGVVVVVVGQDPGGVMSHRLLADYDIHHLRLWRPVPVTMLLAPLLATLLRR